LVMNHKVNLPANRKKKSNQEEGEWVLNPKRKSFEFHKKKREPIGNRLVTIIRKRQACGRRKKKDEATPRGGD